MHDDRSSLSHGAETRQAEQRRHARRTALCVGALAVAVYCAFILSGVIGR